MQEKISGEREEMDPSRFLSAAFLLNLLADKLAQGLLINFSYFGHGKGINEFQPLRKLDDGDISFFLEETAELIEGQTLTSLDQDKGTSFFSKNAVRHGNVGT